MAPPVFEPQPPERVRVSRSISDQIFAAVQAGTFVAGGSLPSERSLAERFGVSRSSVREAIRLLEQSGVVEVIIGSGTYVRNDAMTPGAALRVRSAIVGDESPLDIVIARQALEPTVAEYAALKRGDADLLCLEANLKQHEAALMRGEETLVVDREFHQMLSRATHNATLVMLMEHLVNSMSQRTWSTLKSLTHTVAGSGELALAQHRAVFEAVLAYDAETARSAMTRHLRTVEQALLAGPALQPSYTIG